MLRVAAVSSKEDPPNELLTLETLNDARSGISTNTKAVLLFIAYLIIGLLFYVYVDGLSALDTIYLAVITFSTVGYGDIPVGNRIFTTFYVLLGAGIVGAYFGIFSNDVMEAQEEALQRRLVNATMSMNDVVNKTTQQIKDYQVSKLKQYIGALDERDPQSLSQYDQFKRTISKAFLEQIHTDTAEKMKNINIAIYEEELREIRSKGIVDGFFLFVALISGAIGMMIIEDWNFSDALYWASVTACTVGYGDVTPDTDSGKIFTIFYTIISCALAAKGFRDVVTYPMVVRAKENELRITQQFGEELSERTLRSIINTQFFKNVPNLRKDDKSIVKSEFVLLMLHMMNKVHDKDIQLASKIFDRLDTSGCGILSEADQMEQIMKARQRDQEKKREEQRREAELQQQRANMKGFERMFADARDAMDKVGDRVVSFGDAVGEAATRAVNRPSGKARSHRGSSFVADEFEEDPRHGTSRKTTLSGEDGHNNPPPQMEDVDLEDSSYSRSAAGRAERMSGSNRRGNGGGRQQYQTIRDEETNNPMITDEALEANDHHMFTASTSTGSSGKTPKTPPPGNSKKLTSQQAATRSSFNLQSPLK